MVNVSQKTCLMWLGLWRWWWCLLVQVAPLDLETEVTEVKQNKKLLNVKMRFLNYDK